MVKQQGRELASAQMQLADHYDFAASLGRATFQS